MKVDVANFEKILIVGGSGFIGTKLSQALLNAGYSVCVLDFVPPSFTDENLSFLKIDMSKSQIPKEFDGEVSAIINLAGKNIFGRWTKGFKKGVYNSRILSTRNIVESIYWWGRKPEVFISASAFGFYGDKGENLVEENSTKGKDFLAEVCLDWEAEANKAKEFGVRVVNIRTALVLGNKGLLAPLFMPFRFGLGAWIGKGSAWFPWIHIDDVVGIYLFALSNKNVQGPINTVAPELVRQKEFMKIFGSVFKKRVLFSIPIFMLKLKYGDLAKTFNNSAKMSAQKILNLGYIFKYSKLSRALKQVVSEKA